MKIFDKTLTKRELFYDQNGGEPVYVYMMHRHEYYRYGKCCTHENLNASIDEDLI